MSRLGSIITGVLAVGSGALVRQVMRPAPSQTGHYTPTVFVAVEHHRAQVLDGCGGMLRGQDRGQHINVLSKTGSSFTAVDA